MPLWSLPNKNSAVARSELLTFYPTVAGARLFTSKERGNDRLVRPVTCIAPSTSSMARMDVRVGWARERLIRDRLGMGLM